MAGKKISIARHCFIGGPKKAEETGKKEIDIWTPQEYVLCTLLSTKLRSLWEKGSPEISPCPRR